MNRLRNTFLLFFGCIAAALSAQNPAVVDSLEREARDAPNDSLRIEAYAALCDYIYPYDNEQRGKYALKIISLSVQQGPDGKEVIVWPKGRARGLYQMGNYYYFRSEYAEALPYFYQSLKINEQIGRKSGIAACLSAIARVHVELGQWAEAEENYRQSRLVYESIGFTRGVRSVLINSGVMFGRQKRDAEALVYYLEAEKTYTDPNDHSQLGTVYSNIGLCYKNTGQPALARAYYDKALTEYANTGETENLELLQLNLGDVYLDEGNNAEALRYYTTALHSGLQYDRKSRVQTAYNQLALVHIRLAEAAVSPAVKDSLYHKAFEFNGKARLYGDSIFNTERSKQLSELQVRYETEKKERAISQLNTEAKASEIALLKQEVELRQRRLEALSAREQSALLEKTNANYQLELQVNEANLRRQNAENEHKQQALELLNKEYALRETEARRERAVSWALKLGLAGFALLLFVLLRLFWQKNRANRAMMLQNREILRQQQKIEDQNRRLEEASRFKSNFLSNMSHEIRTPLNTVINVSELLADTPLSHQQNAYTNAISHASRNLLALINDILDLSKIEAGKIDIRPAPLHLAEFLRQQTDMLRFNLRDAKVRLELLPAADLPATIVTDGGRLSQVLLNLLGNALKFTEQGNITLFCSVAERRSPEDLVLQFAVQDTGIGIPPDKLEHIFDAFAQAEADTHLRYGGTGLGLAITKQLVEIQGGTLTVESTVGQGSTFRFTLPVKVAESAPVLAPPSAGSEKLPSCRILLVEDNLLNQMLAREMLEKIVDRPAITLAQNGREAMEKAGAQAYDLILMDIRMPVMDGFAAAAALRETGLQTPILALTANATNEEEQKCLAAGMNDYLSKPIDLAQLREKIGRWAGPSEKGAEERNL